MSEINSYTFHVNSFEVCAQYFRKDVEQIFLPLIKTLDAIHKAKRGRVIAFLAAPPGAGKTTLSLLLQHLSNHLEDVSRVQSVGLDGFHYPRDYIANRNIVIDNESVPMTSVKGCPETFDLYKTKTKIRALRETDVKWPIYDRILHDVAEEQLLVTGEIILIEGNWLLLDEPGWRELADFCDYSIFISADEAMLKQRLIARKIKGGLDAGDAHEFFQRSDLANVRRALKNRLDSNLTLHLQENGEFLGGSQIETL